MFDRTEDTAARGGRWTAAQIPDQSGRTAIVTGANSGIGYETALQLAMHGANVVVASRSPERGEHAAARLRAKAPAATIEFETLDLADLSSVRRFASAFLTRHHRLDLLINNAGVMMPPRRQQTVDGFELQFGTNHLGHFALTLQLLDLLVATAGSRIVTVASSAQNFGELSLDDLQWTRRRYRRMASYGASKIANMLFSNELQRRLAAAGAPTRALACHPGWTATNLQRTSRLFRIFNPLLAMRPWQGALPTLYAAVAHEAVGGAYYGPDGLMNLRGYPAPNAPCAEANDADAAQRLWALSEELVGIKTPILTHGRIQ